MPLAQLQVSGVNIPAPGGNEWSHEEDIRRGLDKYVHLCLLPEHPMEYTARVKDKRILESQFIRVSTEVIQWAGIRFTAGVANKAGSKLLTLQEACKGLNFDVVYFRTNWKDREINQMRQAAKRYELLVPATIPANLLKIS